MEEALIARWGSRLSTDYAWVRGRVRSIQALPFIFFRASASLPRMWKQSFIRSLACLVFPESVMTCASCLTAASQKPGWRLITSSIAPQRKSAGLAAVLGGIDGLVFTAGIGENSPEIRRRIGEASAWLGIEIDAEANTGKGPRISTPCSKVSAWVIPTNEELMIARHTGSLLGLR